MDELGLGESRRSGRIPWELIIMTTADEILWVDVGMLIMVTNRI